MPIWLEKLAPILVLLVAVSIVIIRLPKIDLGHSEAFRKRRVMNWLPLGLTYAFLYMGRYNLKVSKFAFEGMQDPSGGAMMGNDDFGIIFAVGTLIYGCSFVINGPLTDRIGGRKAILIGAAGAAVANLMMGIISLLLVHHGAGYQTIAPNFVLLFSILYGINMYFQSFGAVAIVKVNASWFHVRERGVFGAIFGILISLGIYFAFDWGSMILSATADTIMVEGAAKQVFNPQWVFFAPALLLSIFWVLDVLLVQNTPGEAGQKDFDTADASSGDDGARLPTREIFKRMLQNPIIMTIACVEFCSGFLRQAIMQWYRTFAKQTDAILGLKDSFVYDNWGMLLCVAGILGGVIAGTISDHVFQSRRGPVATILYGVMLTGAIVLTFTYTTPAVGLLVLVMSLSVIGVHGMLSGTASMDFGGRKNVGTAVGIIDGFVYLGTGLMSVTYAILLPKEEFDAAGDLMGPVLDPANWIAWPVAMIPFAVIGLLLATRVWNAKPQPRKA